MLKNFTKFANRKVPFRRKKIKTKSELRIPEQLVCSSCGRRHDRNVSGICPVTVGIK